MLRLTRSFQTSAIRKLAVGDSVPSALLQNGSPSATVNLAEATAKGKYLVIGVPGAFSPGCSQRHVPGYLQQIDAFKAKGIKHIYVVSVNDSFVTGAWQNDLLNAQQGIPEAANYVSVLADPTGEFSREWDVLFDASKFFGNSRSKRYAALIDNGKVEKTFVEKDSTGISDSEASNVVSTL